MIAVVLLVGFVAIVAAFAVIAASGGNDYDQAPETTEIVTAEPTVAEQPGSPEQESATHPEDLCLACGEFWPCAGSEFDPGHTATPMVSYGYYRDARNGGYVVTESRREVLARFPSYQEARAERDRRAALTNRKTADHG